MSAKLQEDLPLRLSKKAESRKRYLRNIDVQFFLSLHIDGTTLKGRLNPCQSVERFALDNERVLYLTEDEEQRFFQALGNNQQLKDIVTVALHTGMRRGETLT